MLDSTNFLFTVVNLVVLPFWFLMICLPRWIVTRRLMASYWVILLLPVVYIILVIPELPAVLPLLLQPKLNEIATLLGRPEGALLAGFISLPSICLSAAGSTWIARTAQSIDCSAVSFCS